MKLFDLRYFKFGILITISFILIPFGCDKPEESENKAPTCSITSPDNDEEIEQGTTVTISVDADDSDGNVTEVSFYIDGSGIGSSSSFPYNYDWNTSGEETGSHTIKAIAKDNDGSSTSDEIAVLLTEGVKPDAAFTASQTSVNPGASVQFTDQSSNTPTSWSWDFGDGGTSTSQNPSHSYSSTGSYNVSLTATNSYGSDTETKSNYITVFTETGTVTDYDDNIYNTIKIGNQWWMAENLKTTHYSDGTSIPLVEDKDDWANLGYEGIGMCYYDNSSTNADTYGALYSWAAAANSAQVCPTGWHLPSDAEWKQLEMYLGMSQADADNTGYNRGTNEGSKLAGNSELWEDGALENDAVFGTSGFLALPGSGRGSDGSFDNLGRSVCFWSATEGNEMNAWIRMLTYDGTTVYRNPTGRSYGFPVRCIKD